MKRNWFANRFKNQKYVNQYNISHKFKAEVNGEVSKLTIYGDIGETWWGESISASDVEKELKNMSSDKIEVHINSYGGDAFDGIAIYNQLKNHSAKIIVHIDGLAASAASIIAMAADELVMNTGSMLMIHEGSTIAWGTKGDIGKTLNSLTKLDKSIADVYMTRFTGEREEIDTLIVNETWFTADEAIEVGLADKVNNTKTSEEVDPEEYKNNLLKRIRNRRSEEPPVVESAQPNILANFQKRPE